VPFAVLALVRPAGTSTAQLLTVAVVATVAVSAQRALSYMSIRALRSRGWFAETTLIIGAGKVARELAATLAGHPEYGLCPIGFLDDIGEETLPLPVFGGVDLLAMVLAEERVDRVVVAFGAAREADLVRVLRACDGFPVEIHVLPRFFELGTTGRRGHVDDVWGYPLLWLRRSRLEHWTRSVKRTIDVIVALTALLVLSPLYALLALAVKVSSPGPVHFRQERIGQHGRHIELLKFRTMPENSRSETEWVPSVEAVTRVGRVMRVTGLDEVPQLWNVLGGDMSLIGPRPERPFFVEQFRAEIPRYDDRHRVPVGLTGLAQVHGLRGDTPIDERTRLDNQYIENWSLWRDLVILVQTLSAVIRNTVRPQGVVRTDGTRVTRWRRDRSEAADAKAPQEAAGI
jgi:exopolysaccharide biosynthesis polyprenyl glycosylphosphotransferase